tara:strand:- start:355 stop:609 length:255 start_codon:yes stop_codon:yes gene_type:complete
MRYYIVTEAKQQSENDMRNLTIITITERGTTFRNLTRKIITVDGLPHAKVNGKLIVLESETFCGKPVPNKYEHVIAESTGNIWL